MHLIHSHLITGSAFKMPNPVKKAENSATKYRFIVLPGFLEVPENLKTREVTSAEIFNLLSIEENRGIILEMVTYKETLLICVDSIAVFEEVK
jgi:hypothetical protein